MKKLQTVTDSIWHLLHFHLRWSSSVLPYSFRSFRSFRFDPVAGSSLFQFKIAHFTVCLCHACAASVCCIQPKMKRFIKRIIAIKYISGILWASWVIFKCFNCFNWQLFYTRCTLPESLVLFCFQLLLLLLLLCFHNVIINELKTEQKMDRPFNREKVLA